MIGRTGIGACGLSAVILQMVIAGTSIFAQPEPTRKRPLTLSLADAVAEALAHNARLLDAGDTIVQADLALRLARSEFGPKVTPNVLGSFGQTDVSNQTYGLDVSQRFASGTAVRATLGATTARNQLGDFYSTDTTFLLSQSLLRGFGRNVAQRGLMSAEERVADVARQRALAEQQVAIEVAAAYYAIVSQQRLVTVAEEAVARSSRLLEASQAKLSAGRVSQLDVFRAQQLAAQAENQLLDAHVAVEDAHDRLRELLGRGADYDFSVTGDVPRATGSIAPEAAVELALQHRLELQGAQAALIEADRSVVFARNQLLPQFDLNLALTRRETARSLGSSFGLDSFRFATFIGFSMPVDRTSQSVAHQTTLLERERRRREIEMLRMRIESETRRAVRHQERLFRSVDVTSAGVEFAAKEVELATLRYQRGLSNNLDVVTAEGNLLEAEARRAVMLAELAVAELRLRATLGILDPRSDVK